MNRAMTLGLTALLATAGAAMAGEPMALTDSELDRVTAGSVLVLEVQANLPIQDGTSNTILVVETPIPPSGGSSAPRKPAEFVIVRIGQKIHHALPPSGER